MHQKGAIALVVPFLILLIIAVALFLVIQQGIIKNPFKTLPLLGIRPQEPTVVLQKQYQNPFDKSTQYVNPFSEFKNPFDLIK